MHQLKTHIWGEAGGVPMVPKAPWLRNSPHRLPGSWVNHPLLLLHCIAKASNQN